MKRIVVVLVALFSIFLIGSHPTQAASDVVINITEARINAIFRGQSFDNVSGVYFEVQEGRLGLVGIVDESGLGPQRLVIALTPSINNGHLVWAITGASLNEQYLDGAQLAILNSQFSFTDPMNSLLNYFEGSYASYQVNSIVLTSHTITLHLSRGGSSASASTTPTPVTATGTALTNCSVTTTSALNMRAAAKSTAAIVTVVPTGTQLAATLRSGNYVFVTYSTYKGWLSIKFVKTTGNCG